MQKPVKYVSMKTVPKNIDCTDSQKYQKSGTEYYSYGHYKLAASYTIVLYNVII